MVNLRMSRCFAIAACFLAGAGCGCSPSKGQIEGKVLFEGEALHSGEVTFVGADGNTVSAPISPDGEYRISGVAVGEAKIGVVSRSAVPEGLKNFPNPRGRFADSPAPPPEKVVSIPSRYNDPKDSPLKYLVKSGKQDYPIELAP